MASEKLTAKQIENAEPGRLIDGKGLSLLVKESGSKSWVLRVQRQGIRKDYGLGSLDKLPLADARKKAAQYRIWAAQGKNPKVEAAKVERVIPTFEAAARERYAGKKGEYKNAKHAWQWMATLERHAFPVIGDTPVDEVEAWDIRDALSPIWTTKPETAARVLQRIGKVLDYSLAMGWRDRDAPMRGVRELLPSQKQARKANNYGHFASIHYSDMPEYMARLRGADTTMGRLALAFCILTASRSGEARFLRWSEIDGDVWTVPAAKMKMGVEHKVYLSSHALAILDEVKQFEMRSLDDLVFVGLKNGPISDATMAKEIRLGSAGLKIDDGKDASKVATVHGCRASFRSWIQEQCPTVPAAVAELSLAHKQADNVIAAYNRADFTDMRKDLMQRWGDYAAGRCDNVVSLVG